MVCGARASAVATALCPSWGRENDGLRDNIGRGNDSRRFLIASISVKRDFRAGVAMVDGDESERI